MRTRNLWVLNHPGKDVQYLARSSLAVQNLNLRDVESKRLGNSWCTRNSLLNKIFSLIELAFLNCQFNHHCNVSVDELKMTTHTYALAYFVRMAENMSEN